MARPPLWKVTDDDRTEAASMSSAYRERWGLSITNMASVLGFRHRRSAYPESYVYRLEHRLNVATDIVVAAQRLDIDRSPQEYHYDYLTFITQQKRQKK